MNAYVICIYIVLFEVNEVNKFQNSGDKENFPLDDFGQILAHHFYSQVPVRFTEICHLEITPLRTDCHTVINLLTSFNFAIGAYS